MQTFKNQKLVLDKLAGLQSLVYIDQQNIQTVYDNGDGGDNDRDDIYIVSLLTI